MAFRRKAWKQLRMWKSGAGFCVRSATSGSSVDDARSENEEEGLVFAHAEAADHYFLAFFDVDVSIEAEILVLELSCTCRHCHSYSGPQLIDSYRPLRIEAGR